MIDKLLADFRDSLGPEFVIGVEAQLFVQYCEQNHPDELMRWLRIRSVAFVAEELRSMLHRERAIARQQAAARAFQQASATLATGDRSLFETYYAVSHKNLWRRLGEMTSADLVFVADRYQANGKRSLMWSALFQHMARKVGTGQTVADVYSEAQIADLQKRFLDSGRSTSQTVPPPR